MVSAVRVPATHIEADHAAHVACHTAVRCAPPAEKGLSWRRQNEISRAGGEGVSLYTSRFNPGAADVAAQLEQSFKSSCLKYVRQPPQFMHQGPWGHPPRRGPALGGGGCRNF
eukprot:5719493-Prymnesium_polylepis.2